MEVGRSTDGTDDEPVGAERCKKEWQTFMLLPVILDCQVQQREKVVIIQQDLMCRLLEGHIHVCKEERMG